jgi:hypothetical protein
MCTLTVAESLAGADLAPLRSVLMAHRPALDHPWQAAHERQLRYKCKQLKLAFAEVTAQLRIWQKVFGDPAT